MRERDHRHVSLCSRVDHVLHVNVIVDDVVDELRAMLVSGLRETLDEDVREKVAARRLGYEQVGAPRELEKLRAFCRVARYNDTPPVVLHAVADGGLSPTTTTTKR